MVLESKSRCATAELKEPYVLDESRAVHVAAPAVEGGDREGVGVAVCTDKVAIEEGNCGIEGEGDRGGRKRAAVSRAATTSGMRKNSGERK